jgi:hypothetical protein
MRLALRNGLSLTLFFYPAPQNDIWHRYQRKNSSDSPAGPATNLSRRNQQENRRNNQSN